MESAVQNVVDLVAARPSRDDDTTIFIQKYLTNNNYRSLIAFSLIFMFSLVFYLIYLIVDAVIDKQKHYELCVKSFERYEKRCRAKSKLRQANSNNDPIKDIDALDGDEGPNKSEALERQSKLAFTEWSTRNLQISFIHSVLSSLWLIRIIIVRYEPLSSDLLFYVSWDTYLLVAFSSGYFLYDFYDIYANGYLRREWVVCLHHVIVLVSFSYHMCTLMSVGYTCLALAMEFNSVFLHARKLLSFYLFGKRSLAFLVNMAANVLTFIVFRFGVLGVIYYGVYRDGNRVPLSYLIMLVTLVTMMAIINILLFKRIIQRDVLPLICTRKTKKNNSDECAPIDDKALMADQIHILANDNLPIINNAQSNVVLVMVE